MPLGPNHAMNAFVARSRPVPSSDSHDRHRPRDEQRDRDDGHRRRALLEQAAEGQQRAEDDEDAELEDLDDVVGPLLEVAAQVRPADAERRSPPTYTAMKPVAVRAQHVIAVDRERASPARRAPSGGRGWRRAPARSGAACSSEATAAEHQAVEQAERRRPGARRSPSRSPRARRERGGQREDRRQREAVVEPGLEVERVAHRARHARVGDHRVGAARGRWARAARRAGTPRSSQPGQRLARRPRRSPRSPACRSTSLRSGGRHARWSISNSTSRPSRNRITTSAVTATSLDEARARIEVERRPARRRPARSRRPRTAL